MVNQMELVVDLPTHKPPVHIKIGIMPMNLEGTVFRHSVLVGWITIYNLTTFLPRTPGATPAFT